MKQFNDDNFVLETKTAQDLYHNHAAKMPIIDYHCHLIPEMVANDHRFKSITELWLGGDHYKWRAMRTNGVDERYCTGKDTSIKRNAFPISEVCTALPFTTMSQVSYYYPVTR